MLEVQKYLQSKTLEDLEAELGIVAKKHDVLPLVILNYDQIESPKTNPIVRECRGLVLDSRDWSVVAKSFTRFFNWGEVADEMPLFDFSDFCVQSKEDGSLCIIYYFDGAWHANTRGSFAVDNMQHQDFTWREGFCKALGVSTLHDLVGILDPRYTYVCEFVSPWNKVVRRYDKPAMYLLGMFEGTRELHWQDLEPGTRFLSPTTYEFRSIEEIQDWLNEQAAADPTFEGVVIRDAHGHRWKIKSATYLGLHKMKGEGDNLWNPKHLVPFILSGEDAELLTYYPEVAETYFRVKSEVQAMYIDLIETWADHKAIPDQKEFALAVKANRFSGVLFDVRKRVGTSQRAADVKKAFREEADRIVKLLKA